MPKATRTDRIASSRASGALALLAILGILVLTTVTCGGGKSDTSATEAPMVETTSVGAPEVTVTVHGVALERAVFMPDGLEIGADGQYELTASVSQTVVVTILNQGNVVERQVPVTVILSSPPSPQQKKTVTVQELSAGETVEVQVSGLDISEYSGVTVTVEVGPVPGERYIGNNSIAARVIPQR
jgi:hypothetical protein